MVKRQTRLVGLERESDFRDFVEAKFNFYSSLYLKICDAEYKLEKGLESLYYISYYGIANSLAYPLMMAPILEEDEDKIQIKKLQLVAHYIDCFGVYRSINQRTLGQSSLRYTIFSLVKEIRNKNVSELAEILKAKVESFDESLDGIWDFNLNQQNKRFVRYFLARITQFIEDKSGINSHIDNYMADNIKQPAQIEHIWADIFDYHKDEFEQKSDSNWYRNTFGNLVLLPKGINQSFNKDPYEKKLPHYLKQNLLAQTLHPDCYLRNPNFTNWYMAEGISFKPNTSFKKKDLEERTGLYEQIAMKIWSPERFHEIANY